MRETPVHDDELDQLRAEVLADCPKKPSLTNLLTNEELNLVGPFSRSGRWTRSPGAGSSSKSNLRGGLSRKRI